MRRILSSLFGGPVKEIPQINQNPHRSNQNKSFGADRAEVDQPQEQTHQLHQVAK